MHSAIITCLLLLCIERPFRYGKATTAAEHASTVQPDICLKRSWL